MAAAYSRAIPIFEASDEAEHFIYIHTVLETSALPIIQSSEDMARQPDPVLRWNNQSHHAPLYYLLSAALVSWTQRDDIADYLRANELIFLRNTVEDNPNKWLHRYGNPASDTHVAVYVLRAVNVVLGCATLLLVYLTARYAVQSEFVALLSMLLVAAIPTFIAVNVSVSNDALTILLYTAGLLWIVRLWRLSIKVDVSPIPDIVGAQRAAPSQQSALTNHYNITFRHTLTISLILAAIALTKLTGVSLFAVVYMTLLVGARGRRWSWRDAVRVIVISLVATGVLAGWWYIRNWQLYGDPLALAGTASIWGRETPLTMPELGSEALRIGKSFWMMVGYLHYPVFAPDWFYAYSALITLCAIPGLIWVLLRQRQGTLNILGFALLVVAIMLLWGTRTVDISYGRLLFPAIVAFAVLFVVGW
ncbi:MAG: hypothetical protein L0Z53_00380, partial [Acidobacteriales bacterium]|nr:hypothetical protein [Terriglobales bacterium]